CRAELACFRLSLAAAKRRARVAWGSGDFLTPSPPAEKATARQDQAGQPGADDRTRYRRRAFLLVRRFGLIDQLRRRWRNDRRRQWRRWWRWLTGALLPLVGATVGTVTTCGLGAEMVTAGCTMTGDSGADRDGRLGGVVTPTTAEATEVLAVSNTDIVVGRSTLSGTDTGEPTLAV